MKLTWIVPAVVAGLFWGASPDSADAAEGALKNVSAVKFFIGDFNEFSTKCGLDKGQLKQAFMGRANGGGISETDSSAYWIFIRATTLTYDENSCITNVDASLLVNTRYFDPGSAAEMVGKVQLWTRGGLLISDITEHPAVVTNAFGDLGGLLAEELERDR